MANKKNDDVAAAGNGSGLTDEVIDAALGELLRDPQVVDCLRAIRRGQPADLGFLITSARLPFYVSVDQPKVKGFTPTVVLQGKGLAARLIDKNDPAALVPSNSGFLAPFVADLARFAEPAQFLRSLLKEFGHIQVTPRLYPTLGKSVPYIGASATAQVAGVPPVPTAAPTAIPPFDGRGTTVCIVDMGCDFAHRNFRKPANATDRNLLGSRIKFLIDMKNGGTADQHDHQKIESWLSDATRTPYDAAKADPKPYDPHAPGRNCVPPGLDGTHGTMVMDIAAGNGNGTGLKGVAPAADLVFVQVKVSGTGTAKYVSAASVYEAITYAEPILHALNQPFVINVSLGSNEGPHDFEDHGNVGNSPPWNALIDAIFNPSTAQPNRAKGRTLVWSAGNQARSNCHASGQVRPALPATFDVRIKRGDQRTNTIAFWYRKPANVTFSVQYKLLDYKDAPANYSPPWQAGSSSTLTLTDEAPRSAGSGFAESKYGSKPTDNLHSFKVSIDPPLMRTPQVAADEDRWEIWRIEVSAAATAAFAVPLHAWIDRDDADQAEFKQPVMTGGGEANTLVDPMGSLSAGAASVERAIVVGAIGTATYAPGTPFDTPGVGLTMPFSSAGPNRSGDKRPHVCAPGEIINGAKSKSDPVPLATGYGRAELTAMSGTSMSAPHVAGIAALLYDKAKRLGAQYPAAFKSSTEVRDLLIDTARPDIAGAPPQWEPQRGYGCVDAVEALKK
jgi:subtilisin family serine protease